MGEIYAYNLGARLAADGVTAARFLNRSARKMWADLNDQERHGFARLGRERFAHWVWQGYNDATVKP